MRPSAVALLLLLATTIGVSAQQEPSIPSVPPSTVWIDGPPNIPKGTQVSVLSGDPGKSGTFTILLKMPANSSVPAHTHPTMENVTVLSGPFYLGMGDKLDKTRGELLKPGTLTKLPANMAHFAYTGDAETVIQITAEGPFEINYVDPADDPSRNPAGAAPT